MKMRWLLFHALNTTNITTHWATIIHKRTFHSCSSEGGIRHTDTRNNIKWVIRIRANSECTTFNFPYLQNCSGIIVTTKICDLAYFSGKIAHAIPRTQCFFSTQMHSLSSKCQRAQSVACSPPSAHKLNRSISCSKICTFPKYFIQKDNIRVVRVVQVFSASHRLPPLSPVRSSASPSSAACSPRAANRAKRPRCTRAPCSAASFAERKKIYMVNVYAADTILNKCFYSPAKTLTRISISMLSHPVHYFSDTQHQKNWQDRGRSFIFGNVKEQKSSKILPKKPKTRLIQQIEDGIRHRIEQREYDGYSAIIQEISMKKIKIRASRACTPMRHVSAKFCENKKIKKKKKKACSRFEPATVLGERMLQESERERREDVAKWNARELGGESDIESQAIKIDSESQGQKMAKGIAKLIPWKFGRAKDTSSVQMDPRVSDIVGSVFVDALV